MRMMMGNAISNWFEKEKKVLLLSLGVGFVVTTVVGLYTLKYSDRIQRDLADNVIRFHVLANSDTPVDQELKLKVRDGIIQKYYGEMETSHSIEQSRAILLAHMDDIQQEANDIIKENGFDYQAKVSLGKSDFPTKQYGNIAFPPGEYEALKIEIGQAEGQNWWCVMFPPLCFVDITQQKPTTTAERSVQKEPVLFTPVAKEEKTTTLETTSLASMLELEDKETKEKQPTETEETAPQAIIPEEPPVLLKTALAQSSSKGTVSQQSKEMLKETLNPEAFDIITKSAEEGNKGIKVKFKIVEFWQNFRHKDDDYFVKK